MAEISNKYKDLKAGFEIEASFIFLKDAQLKNKTVLATVKRQATGKDFFKVVVEGNNGGYAPYPEFVSEALNTTEEIEEFFKVIRYIVSSVTKRPETLSKLLNLNNGIFNVEFAHKAYPNLNIEIDLKGGGDPNSIHINLDVPFIKLSKLANSSLYSNFDISKPFDGILTDRNLRDCAPLKYAYGIVKTCKEFQSFVPKLKQLMMLFFYQNTVYIQEDIQKETVEFPVEDTFKDYVENMQGRAAVGKLKFDVLFKVGKADIMHTILTPADNRQLVNDTVRTKIVDILKKIAVLSSAKSNNPNGFPAEKYCECLYANALNDGYYYDEPRISGLIRPKKIGEKEENGYYVVAELRTTNLNDVAKNVYSRSYTEDTFKRQLSGFIKKLCDFVKELTD